MAHILARIADYSETAPIYAPRLSPKIINRQISSVLLLDH